MPSTFRSLLMLALVVVFTGIGAGLGAFAIIGAAAFLAASMSMSLTAIVLVAEFTRIDHDFLVPIILAVVRAMCVSKLCQRRENAGKKPPQAPSCAL